MTADGGVGQDCDYVRLDFEDAAGDEDEFFFVVVGANDAHGARLDAGDQRSVPGVDAQLARFARQCDEGRLAGKDGFFGADYVYVDGGHVWFLDAGAAFVASLPLTPALLPPCGARVRVRCYAPWILLQGLGFFERFLDRADHVEGLFGQGVAFAVDDHLEAADGIG